MTPNNPSPPSAAATDENDELLGFDDNGEPRAMTLANAVQVWAFANPDQPCTVERAAAVFHTTEKRIRWAVETHPWMFLTGEHGDEIEHEGE